MTSAAGGLRLSHRAVEGAVRVSATHRLRVLEDMVHDAELVRLYGSESAAGSAWELDCGDRRFTLLTSADARRGFSGEGRALDALADPVDERLVSLLRGALRWRSSLDAAALAAELGEREEELRRGLIELGTRGVVGFDLSTRNWFHRELPYDARAMSMLQPRYAAAQRLAELDGGVRLVRDCNGTRTFAVAGSGVTHTVALDRDDSFRCTCAWHSKHCGERGPCKHVLAARLSGGGS